MISGFGKAEGDVIITAAAEVTSGRAPRRPVVDAGSKVVELIVAGPGTCLPVDDML